MKVFADKLGYEKGKFVNFKKLWFPLKPVDVQLGTISENARIIGSCYWLLSMCQILCLYQKVHNLPEISSYAAGLSLLLLCKTRCSYANWVCLHDKHRGICIKLRSPQGSLPFKGQVTE